MISGLFKPHYFFRPSQVVRRLSHVWGTPPGIVIVTLPWGVRLAIDPREEIGRAMWNLGVYDLAVCEVLWRLAAAGDTVIDIGANLGQMTGLLAIKVGVSGRVLAFEPHAGVFASLLENVGRVRSDPRAGAVEVFPAAVSATEGTATLDCGDYFSTNRGIAKLSQVPGAVGDQVSTTTVDAVLGGGTAALVKIDVEGGEADVVAGGRQALAAGRIRNLVYEAYGDSGMLADLLAGYGYETFAIGRRMRGLVLAAANESSRLPAYEPPSYLSTRDPETALRLLRPSGWQVLARAARGPARTGPR